LRFDNVIFAALNAAEAKSPRYVIEIAFDTGNTDLWYFTSHDDALLPAGVTTNKTTGCISNLSSTSQSIDPIKSIFTIGSVSFEVADKEGEITALLKTKWDADQTTSNKRVRVYMGYEELETFDDYVLLQTQLLANITQGKGSYSWQCRDIQRQANKEIFEPYTTNLRATVSATATEIPVFAAVDNSILHDSQYGDAPGQQVGYIRIYSEIIRYTGVDTTPGANAYTGCTRGVLNTRPAQHTIDTSPQTDNSRQPEVSEVIYFEGAAPKQALKILTGNYGGETFPGHWHLGIPPEFVASSLFTGIGDDWWDTATDDGVQVRFVLPKKQDGKKFIEKEIMLAIGAFMPIGSDGQIGLKRMTGVLSSASGVVELNESNIVSYSNLIYKEEDIQNLFAISWNHDPIANIFTRNSILDDQDSVAKFKPGKTTRLKFTGIHGSKTTQSVLFSQMDSLRNRYAGYPKGINIEVLPSQNVLEAGDVPRVNLPNVPDHTGETSALDSAFEVQQVSVNWITGTVNLRLFGSSDSMTPYSLIAQDQVQPDSWYQTLGTNLQTYCDGLGGRPLMDGSGVITSGGHIAGAPLVENAMYYRIGDLTIDAGVTVTIDNNVLIANSGFRTINGVIDGSGAGVAGVAGVAGELNGTAGVPGYIGDTKSDGGIDAVSVIIVGASDIQLSSQASSPVSGVNASAIPPLNIKWIGGTLTGLTGDFRGTSGGGGGSIVDDDPVGDPVATGGTGGAGGAGLVLISQGHSMGVSGNINLSGAPGDPGGTGLISSTASANHIATAGSGASGCPGALYVITDGSLQTVGDVQHTALRPASLVVADAVRMGRPKELASRTPASKYVRSYDQAFGGLEFGDAAFIHQFLPNSEEPQEDIPIETSDVLGLNLGEVLNSNAQTTKITNLEISVDEPADGNYSHAVAYIRRANTTDAYVTIGVVPFGGEIVYQVAADGAEWEILAKSVSISNTESPSGPTDTIKTTNLIDPNQSQGQEQADNVNTQLPIPMVTGLEVFGQGNNTEFGGRDCKFSWNKVAGIEFVDFGSEPDGIGAGAGSDDYYFDTHIIRIYDDAGNFLRTDLTKNTDYIYSYERNAEDYLRENGTPGAYRNFEIRVTIRSIDNREGEPAKLAASNPAPSLLSGVDLAGIFQGIRFKAQPSTDIDFQGIRVWLSETQGFTPDDLTLKYDGANLEFTINQLKTNTQYYLRYSPYDAYGPDDANISSELVVSTQKSLAGATEGGFVDTVAIGGAFVATGDSAYADIDPGDTVVIPPGDWRLDMGPVSDGPITYVVRFHDGLGESTFSIDSDGNAIFAGDLEAAGGTFTGDLVAGSIFTALADKRIEINPSDDNEAHFYGDTNGGVSPIMELATIGIHAQGGDNVVGTFGAATGANIGVLARSGSYRALMALSGTGVAADIRSGGTGFAMEVDGGLSGYGGRMTGGKGPLNLIPSGAVGAPTHSANSGTLWVDFDGVLYIRTRLSGWQKVGAQ
jgi:hypothetical protein